MMSLTVTILGLAALTGFAQGEGCYCTEQYDPVCASNGQTFSNRCMLRCHNLQNHDNLQVVGSDRCSTHPEVLAALPSFPPTQSCYCTEQYDPVCASNGQTFSNRCMLRCHNVNNHDNLEVVGSDRCSTHPEVLAALPSFPLSKFNCFRRCPHTPLPVCGSDGVTYGSSCALNCVKQIHDERSGLMKVHDGPCNTKVQPQMEVEQVIAKASEACICTDEYRPVCGNNLHTYGNMCAFKCDAKKDSSLKIINYGRCMIMP